MHKLSKFQRQKLLENPNVEKLTKKHVVFTPEFKIHAVEEYFRGKSQVLIFKDADIDLSFFISTYPVNSIKKWREKHQTLGKSSFFTEYRGLGSSGRPKKINYENLSYDELLAIIDVQEGVIEELKKKKALAKKKS